MIFVSVGANPHPFDRLVKKIDEMVGNGKIKEEVVLQIGTTSYKPKYIKKVKKFWDVKEHEEILRKCSLIISHGGLGNIIDAHRHRKPIIIVPRQRKFNEHIDDHQSEIARYLGKKKVCYVVYDLKDLEKKIKKAKKGGIMWRKRVKPKMLNTIRKYVELILEK